MLASKCVTINLWSGRVLSNTTSPVLNLFSMTSLLDVSLLEKRSKHSSDKQKEDRRFTSCSFLLTNKTYFGYFNFLLLHGNNIDNHRTIIKTLFRICILKRRLIFVFSKSVYFEAYISSACFCQAGFDNASDIVSSCQ